MIRKVFSRYRFWLILALLFATQVAIVGAFFLAVRIDLDAPQRALLDQLLSQRIGLFALLSLMLITAQGTALKFLIDRYLDPMARLAEEAILLTSNPAHRIAPEGAREVRELGMKLNKVAATLQQLHEDVETKIDNAHRALAEEKNRLAALMSELAQSVLVCNIEGTILLYNTRARQLLDAGQGNGSSGSVVGLGRSLFAVLDRSLIIHALEQIQYQMQYPTDNANAVAGFVTTLGQGQIVRAQMAPVLDSFRMLNGFVLTLEDITRAVEADKQRDALQQLLAHDVSTTLDNVFGIAENMQDFPDMIEEERQQCIAAIIDESKRLARRIEITAHQNASDMIRRWHQEEMRGKDLLSLLKRRIDAVDFADDAQDEVDGDLWVKVDSYAFIAALSHLVHRLIEGQHADVLGLRLMRDGGQAYLELRWHGSALPASALRLWETEPLPLAFGKESRTMSSVFGSKDGEATYVFDAPNARSSYRVPLPLAEPRAPLNLAVKPRGRPEFYDFDLFRQASWETALDERPLAQLSFTVFDTETTGLNPSGGDEIISIGALRIVNGRLLAQESFDQLVQPGMLVSPESTAVHGITDAMLKGRPRIEKVLPQFHRFAQDTVLIAHNAAFDMKFLQMKEAQTGVRFSQPVLDTLLLSQVVHPHQKDHSLDAIAQRFGVDVVGRHTALGDTLVTGEVFLKMLPLLAEKGIFTLKQAREAVQQTAYARLRY
ncbi:exonuclease domain-containing protein [Noviherbaspirillum agri]